MATIFPYSEFNSKEDAKALRKAMKGFGCDEAAIMAIICSRSNKQRQDLITAYKQVHGRELMKDLKSELSGNFENVILGLMTPLSKYLAQEIRRAIKGIGTDEGVLIEIICTRTNDEISNIKKAYSQLYNRSMEQDIVDDLSGDFKHLMMALMTASRPEDRQVNLAEAKKEAKELKTAGVDRWGTDEGVFITALCSNSLEQTKAIFKEYKALAGHDIMDAIEKEMSSSLKTAFLTIVKCMHNTPLYFAERLEKAMRGLGTDNRTLIRILVSRCEVDLADIIKEYQRIYGKSLVKAVEEETSGDYRKALMYIITGAPNIYG
ncbi:annexin A4-like [Varroa jacobsoni]|uniref:Annexin n=1 Tax=Varroa destructor TaxID=109461 RepID=A0A7M7JNW0_VARDE|nr:annexin A4-like [Varroa destructor]XP_022704315.1 annexin A4-like [Varroa jacobsoni]